MEPVDFDWGDKGESLAGDGGHSDEDIILSNKISAGGASRKLWGWQGINKRWARCGVPTQRLGGNRRVIQQ
jgi:hypothetical protein